MDMKKYILTLKKTHTNKNKTNKNQTEPKKPTPRIIFINLIGFLFSISLMGRQTSSVGLGSDQPRKWEF